MALNRATIGERYRHKWSGDIAEVLEVTGSTVFLRWSNGVKSSMSTAQFIRLFTYHIPWRLQQVASFETDEFEGIRIGQMYKHKNDYRTARVKDFYEKGGVVFVTYVWSDERKSGARPVQSFKDTFEGFAWNDYEHYVRPGWRFVDKETRECITVLHVLDDGERIKYEYIKKAVKRTDYLWDFWQKFRPYAGRETDADPGGAWLAVIFDVNSARVWDTRYNNISLDDLLLVLNREIPGLLEREQGIRIAVLSLPSGNILYDDYVEEWQVVQGKPDESEIVDFMKKMADRVGSHREGKVQNFFSHNLQGLVTGAILSWKPVEVPTAQQRAWNDFRKTLPDDHWIDKVVLLKPKRSSK